MSIKSKIIEIGEMAYFEDYPILILFNDTAPMGLREVSIIHQFEDEPNRDMLQVGSQIILGDKTYTIEKLGNVVNETLFDLGHVSLYFELEEDQEIMPGAALLTPHEVPVLNVGDSIEFIK